MNAQPPNHPWRILTALLGACTFMLSAAGTHADDTKPPMNVLLLLADDWRYDTLTVAGNPVVQTPNIDKLSAEGVRFTQACVTTAICGVSRASILTGQWMSRHGNHGFNAFNTPWSETYPSILRENGYHIGHVGKWHCGTFPADQFDFGRSYNGKHWMPDGNGGEIHVTQKNLQDTMEFFDTRPKGKPFMLNLCFFAPHAQDGNPAQYLPQEKSMSLYQHVTIPNPPLRNETALHNLPPFLQDERNEGRIRYHWRFDTAESYQRMMKNYYRLCTEVDEVCGAVIERLRTEGLLDNTLIIFIGDNGYFHGDRMLADKWFPYNESIRVPLIIRDPRMAATTRGTTNDEFVLNVDVAPTILAGTGMKTPTTMQGRDCAPLYMPRDKFTPWRTEFFYEHATVGNQHRIPASQALVRKDVKFTYWPEWNYEELYNLTQDPQEQHNLIADPKHKAQGDALRNHLVELAKQAK